jgi:hypothetical protein
MGAPYVDASQHVTNLVQDFANDGVKAIGRYYNYGAGQKVLSRVEAQAIFSKGMSIWVTFQYYNNAIKWFNSKLGAQDAARALQCAQEIVGQPEGTTIYFSADFNVGKAEYEGGVRPYFLAVQSAFRRADGTMPYRIGVYSDGYACRRLIEDNIVKDTWLSCSSSFTETGQFRASKKWSIAQTCGVPKRFGIDVDNDDVNAAGFGGFSSLAPLTVSHAAPVAAAFHSEFVANANRAEKLKRKRKTA